MTEFKQILFNQFIKYARFVLPTERKIIRERLNNGSCLAIGAEVNANPVGLIVILLSDNKEKGYLHTLQVLLEYRGKGIGRNLVSEALKVTKEIGCQEIGTDYSLDYDWSAAMERILSSHCFKQTKTSHLFNIQVNEADLEKLTNWMKKLLRRRLELPPGYQIITHNSLTGDMVEKIEAGRGKWFDQSLCPFHKEEQIIKDRSLILLKDAEPVGWLIICRAGTNAVLYRNMVVKEDHRYKGLFVNLLLKGVEWLSETPNITRAVFNTHTDNPHLFKPIQRVLSPCNLKIKTYVYRRKVF